MKNTTKKIVMTAMFTALTCVVTMIIKVPSPFKGYLNLGDGVVLLCGWLLPPVYGALASGLGSMLADVFSGYVVYAPATFVIKALSSLTAFVFFRVILSKSKPLIKRTVSAVVAQVVMVIGYTAFEWVLYGFSVALANAPLNAVQGVAGAITGLLLVVVFNKAGIFTNSTYSEKEQKNGDDEKK